MLLQEDAENTNEQTCGQQRKGKWKRNMLKIRKRQVKFPGKESVKDLVVTGQIEREENNA